MDGSRVLPVILLSTAVLLCAGCGREPAARRGDEPVETSPRLAGEAVGIAAAEPRFIPFIAEGAALPASHTEVFTTWADDQQEITVNVFARRGEQEPRPLGSFVIDGVAPAPRSFPQVLVTFTVEIDGTVTLSSVHKASGRASSKVVGRVSVRER